MGYEAFVNSHCRLKTRDRILEYADPRSGRVSHNNGSIGMSYRQEDRGWRIDGLGQ